MGGGERAPIGPQWPRPLRTPASPAVQSVCRVAVYSECHERGHGLLQPPDVPGAAEPRGPPELPRMVSSRVPPTPATVPQLHARRGGAAVVPPSLLARGLVSRAGDHPTVPQRHRPEHQWRQ